jgi:hypothetical protein
MQKIKLDACLTRDVKRLGMSRMMRKPLAQMQWIVDGMLGKPVSENDWANTKFLIYSGHDDQLIALMAWLHATNVVQDWADFAANVIFELHYDN